VSDGKTPRTQIPRFKSREEAAAFWDTHDSTEFESEFRPARVTVAEDVQHKLAVPLDRETLTRLVELGRARGVGPATLAAQLIAEGVNLLSTAEATAPSQERKRHG
jgi:hypothetical protein